VRNGHHKRRAHLRRHAKVDQPDLATARRGHSDGFETPNYSWGVDRVNELAVIPSTELMHNIVTCR
jgi:hypothetical protein